MSDEAANLSVLLKAAAFAADKHRHQRRKGSDALPYINHPLEVASALANSGGVTDVALLVAAILHDTIEDTHTSPGELELNFGREVRLLVEEVTDDKSLPKDERKRLQIVHAPELSTAAKQLKIADKICNVADVAQNPPMHWDLERRQRYLAWAEKVVSGCRGVNPRLETLFDETLQAAKGKLGVGA